MILMSTIWKFAAIGAAMSFVCSFGAKAEELNGRIELDAGWRIISEQDANANGVDMSTKLIGDNGHAITSMPATVLNALSQAGVYKDLYDGDNLTKVEELWQQKWWYQTSLNVPEGHEYYTLIFNGINYRAEVWLNGEPIAGNDEMVGMDRRFEFDVTSLVKPGAENILAVKVTPERRTPGLTLGDGLKKGAGEGVDLTDTWMDWINLKFFGDVKNLSSFIPDKGAGIWRKVYLTYGGEVAIRNPYVEADLQLPDLEAATLTVHSDLVNRASEAVSGVLRGKITREGKPDIELAKDVTLQAGETRAVSISPSDVKELNVKNPDVWWPYTWGEPNLYKLELAFDIAEKASDAASVNFGIRKITQHRDNGKLFPEFSDPSNYYLKVNGRDYLVRGAAYTPDLFFANDPQRDRDIMRYAKDLGINIIRWEGKFADDDMLDLADKEGMPVMQGLMCCGPWELYSHWDASDYKVAFASVTDIINNLRAHPSAFLWSNGSDGLPPENILSKYHAILKERNWQNPVVDTVSARNDDWSGIHMAGPYSWRSPAFFFKGGIIATEGSMAETGNDETIPPFDSLKKFIPEDKLWPINEFWEMRAGSAPGNNTLDSIRAAVDNRYGPSNSAVDFTRKAQLAHYENVRAQFESFGALGFESHKMIIFWMLNNHWPSFFGHLFDYYMKQGGGYFGAKKALQPLGLVFDYYATGDRSEGKVYLVNQSPEDLTNLSVVASLYDIDGKLKHQHNADVASAATASSTVALTLPRYDDLGPVYFIRLQLKNGSSELLAESTYWQASHEDIPVGMDPNAMMDAMVLKQDQWADFTALNSMPQVKLASKVEELDAKGDLRRFQISLENPTEHVAFFVRAELHLDEQSGEILPITYSDNYVTVYPGETLQIEAEVNKSQLQEQAPLIFVEGYNVQAQ